MDNSGVIHGPPLPFQPASLFMLISKPEPFGLTAGVADHLHPQRPGEIRRPLGCAVTGSVSM